MLAWVLYWYPLHSHSFLRASVQTVWVLRYSFWFYGSFMKGCTNRFPKTLVPEIGRFPWGLTEICVYNWEFKCISLESRTIFLQACAKRIEIIDRLKKLWRETNSHWNHSKTSLLLALTLLARLTSLCRYFTVCVIKSTILHQNQNCFCCLYQKWIRFLISTSFYAYAWRIIFKATVNVNPRFGYDFLLFSYLSFLHGKTIYFHWKLMPFTRHFPLCIVFLSHRLTCRYFWQNTVSNALKRHHRSLVYVDSLLSRG